MKYKLLLVSPDGKYVTDGANNTKDEVLDYASNMGSRWYFYPFNVLITDKGSVLSMKQRVLDDGGCYGVKGKTIGTFIKMIKRQEIAI